MQVSGKDTTKRVDCEPETACLNAEKRLCFVQFAVAAWARVCVGTPQGRTGADQRGQPYPQGLKIRVCFPLTACPPSREIFSPRRNIPRPHRGRTTWGAYSWAGNSVHTQGVFFGAKIGGLPRIMRTPVRPGCGHISRAERTDVIRAGSLTSPLFPRRGTPWETGVWG